MKLLFFLATARLIALVSAQAPSVSIQHGTVVGSSLLGVDTFNGIPYAEPPTGKKRLTPPKPVQTNFGTITATGVPTACPQFLVSANTSSLPTSVIGKFFDNPILTNITEQGEDCLTINVQRPSGITSASGLPVLFWIYGGGFEFGATQMYDGSPMVLKSVALGQPIIFVAVNYRVGGFGFLAGKELSKEKSTNLGLRDQRLGLKWVQDNIAAFGGDPTKVTIWGESAGSVSVNYHLIINGGDNSYNGGKLFRGGIGDSGAINPTLGATSAKAQAVYNDVVQAAGCSDATDSLQCLRELPYSEYLSAVNAQPALLGPRSIDLSYVPRPDISDDFFTESPEIPFQSGRFVSCPVIVGDQDDEGTLFSLATSNITTNQELVEYFSSYFPEIPRRIPAGLVALYPQNPAAGSPFGTGDLNQLYPQFKRLAALLGDFTFTLKRRIYFDYVSSKVPSWSYIATYENQVPILGTFHATDVLLLYFGIGSPIPRNSILTYYISFVNNLDPNAISAPEALIEWPRYNTSTRSIIQFGSLGNKIISDTFRTPAYKYMKKHVSQLRL